MSEYDSILKEKKKKEIIVVEEEPKFPSFWISLVLIIITLVVSYIIYYNKVLNSDSIVINDCHSILNKYSTLIKNIPILEFKEENNIVGNITYNNDKYNFNIVKNNNNLEFNISNNDKYIKYYLIDNNAYVKVPSINEIVKLDYSYSINTILDIENKIKLIDKNKYIKNIYLDGTTPIIEVNLTLNKEELNNIFGLGLKDEYEVIATLKNNAIMNNIEEIKIVINNKTKKDRRVVTITSNEIIYVVGSDTYKMHLESEDNNNFIFKISKNDVLYSVISGNDNGDNYQYTYQVIDVIYNINVISTKNNNEYLYEIKSKRDNIDELMNINLKVENSYLIESDTTNFIDSNNNLIKDKYDNDINYFKDKLLKFIK